MAKEKKPLTIVRASADAEKAIDVLIKRLNKESPVIEGEDMITLGKYTPKRVNVISTGSLQIDAATYYGGIPVGRVIEIFGPEGAGKSTLMKIILANAQKKFPDKYVGLIDFENDFEEEQFEVYGGDNSKILVARPYMAEDGMKTLEEMLDTGHFSIIAIDSIAAMKPRAELESEIGDAHMAIKARLMDAVCGRVNTKVALHETSILWLNQIREKPGVMYGSPESQPGGRAVKFYSSLRMRVSKHNENKEGHTFKVNIHKTKAGPSRTEVEPTLIYGVGFDYIDEVIEAGVLVGIIEKVTTQTKKWISKDGTEFQWTGKTFDKTFGEGYESVLDNPYFKELSNDVSQNLFSKEEIDIYEDE